MGRCEVCGNDYDKTMEISRGGETHVFDSFECAIHAMAPACDHCGCRIVGHGIEANGSIYCCAHSLRPALGCGGRARPSRDLSLSPSGRPRR